MANTTQIGTTTEGMILAALLRAGKTVLIPFGDQPDYDLVMEDGGCFFRIQCKTGRLRNGSVQFNLYTMAQEGGTKKHVRRGYGDRVDMFYVWGLLPRKPKDIPRAAHGSQFGHRCSPDRANREQPGQEHPVGRRFRDMMRE